MSSVNHSVDPNDVAVLSATDQEYLLYAIEFSLPIRTRGKFFVWSQTYLQALIEHELFLGGYGDFRRDDFTVLRMSALPCADKQIAEICDPKSGLMVRAIEAWYKNGEEPLVIHPGMGNAVEYGRFRTFLERHNIANFVMHGAGSVDGGSGAYFLMAGVTQAFGARHTYLLHLIMPYLRAALERILAFEQRQGAAESAPQEDSGKFLTMREIEILQWVQEGKSNGEIGKILAISPATVKNHVQNVLKRLKVHNRAQAVARANSLKLLK